MAVPSFLLGPGLTPSVRPDRLFVMVTSTSRMPSPSPAEGGTPSESGPPRASSLTPPGWAGRVGLAPLEGIGHPVLLACYDALPGVGLLGVPFVSVGRGGLQEAPLSRLVPPEPLRTPMALQLLGKDPDAMARAAERLAALGAAVVDVNLGCPARKVVARGAGAALLRDPEQVYQVVRAVRQAVSTPVSAKLRSGDQDAALLRENLEAVQAAGVDTVTLHPRTRRQGYSGVADWAVLAQARSWVQVPLVGSGDAWFARDVWRMAKETGCDAVVLGRPAIRNPWIFEQAAALRQGTPPPAVSGRQVVAWLEALAARYGERVPDRPRLVAGKLKEIVRYLGSAVPDGGVFRREALRAEDAAALLRVAERHLAHRSPADLDLGEDGPYRLVRSGGVETCRDAYSQPTHRPA